MATVPRLWSSYAKHCIECLLPDTLGIQYVYKPRRNYWCLPGQSTAGSELRSQPDVTLIPANFPDSFHAPVDGRAGICLRNFDDLEYRTTLGGPDQCITAIDLCPRYDSVGSAWALGLLWFIVFAVVIVWFLRRYKASSHRLRTSVFNAATFALWSLLVMLQGIDSRITDLHSTREYKLYFGFNLGIALFSTWFALISRYSRTKPEHPPPAHIPVTGYRFAGCLRLMDRSLLPKDVAVTLLLGAMVFCALNGPAFFPQTLGALFYIQATGRWILWVLPNFALACCAGVSVGYYQFATIPRATFSKLILILQAESLEADRTQAAEDTTSSEAGAKASVHNETYILRRPRSLRTSFLARGLFLVSLPPIMVFFTIVTQLCVLSTIPYNPHTFTQGTVTSHTTRYTGPARSFALLYGAAGFSSLLYVYYQQCITWRYFEVTLSRRPSLWTSGIELSNRSAALMDAVAEEKGVNKQRDGPDGEASGDPRDAVTFVRDENPFHLLLGLQALTPIQSLIAVSVWGFAVMTLIVNSLLSSLLPDGATSLSMPVKRSFSAATFGTVVLASMMLVGQLATQHAFSARRRTRSSSSEDKITTSIPLLGGQVTTSVNSGPQERTPKPDPEDIPAEPLHETMPDLETERIKGKTRSRVTRVLMYLASWHGQQALTLGNHGATFVVTGIGLLLDRFEVVVFGYVTLGLSALGFFLSLQTYLTRTFHFLKVLPTDDSFRMTVLLKGTLLVLKAQILLNATNSYDLVFLALFALSLITLAIFTFVNVWQAWFDREIFSDIHFPRVLLVGFSLSYVWVKLASFVLIVVSYIFGSAGATWMATNGSYEINGRVFGTIPALLISLAIVLVAYMNNEMARYLQGRMLKSQQARLGGQGSSSAQYGLAEACGGLAGVAPYVLFMVFGTAVGFTAGVNPSAQQCDSINAVTPCYRLISTLIVMTWLAVPAVIVVFISLRTSEYESAHVFQDAYQRAAAVPQQIWAPH